VSRRTEILIRNATIKDLDSIQEIEDASFADNDDPFPRRVFLNFLRKYPEGFRIAEQDSFVVGYCYTSPPERRLFSKNPKATIYSLAVSPSQRRLGIGSMLLRDAIDRLRGRRVILELQVAVQNIAAQELYKKFGFAITGTRYHYYGAGKDAYEMNLEIP